MRKIIFAFLASLALLAPCSAASIERGKGLICDTAEQAERFVALTDEVTWSVAVEKVNEEANNPKACGVGVVVFERIEKTKTITDHDGNVIDVWKILVRAVFVEVPGGASFVPVEPKEQFTLFRSTDKAT